MSEEKLIELSNSLIDIIAVMLDEIENGRPISEARKDLWKLRGLIPGLIKNAGM